MTEKAKPTKSTERSNMEIKAVIKPKPAQKAKVEKVVKAPAQAKTATTEQNVTPAAKAAKPLKSAKPVKQKMIRDSFTLPEGDYANLNLLKAKCLEKGVEVKKSELMRAGLTALTKMPIATLIKAVSAVERLKTGRPKGN